jgi:predicted choloylglycine hydrolase
LDHPLHKEVKNKDSKTASQVFMEEHRPLVKEAKNWIKDRSDSCMLVATLIATITFAAAITVPGGNNQDKGTPIFLRNHKFSVFIWSNAVAFFSSMTSLLVFIANMKGYYTEEEFVMVLPKRLTRGLNFLFVAVVTTMVAFIAALSLFLEDRFKNFTLDICLLASLPFFYSVMLLVPSHNLMELYHLIIPKQDVLVWQQD